MPTGAAVLHLATVAAMVAFLVWLWAQASERPLRAGVLTLALLAAWLAYVAAMALGGVTTRVDTLPPGGFLRAGAGAGGNRDRAGRARPARASAACSMPCR